MAITPQQFAQEIRQKVDQLRRDNRPLLIAAQTTHASMSNRIFTEGKATDNAAIGSYSTKDIWIKNKVVGEVTKDNIGASKVEKSFTATRNQKGFNPLKGKKGNTKFKTDPERKRKTSYFEGWKGFRETQGLRSNYVNLNNTGDLFSDFSRPVQKINPAEYNSTISRELNVKKAEGNESHFGKTIFRLSADEKKLFFKTAELELKNLFQP